MQEPRIYERTIYEARLDIAYGQRFHELNERFFRHVDFAFGFVGLFGGAAVFSATIGQWPAIAVISSALVAAGAIIERLIRPVDAAAMHRQWREKFADLLMRVDSGEATQLAQIDSGLRLLQGRGPNGVYALAPTAYNLTVASSGRTDYQMPVSTWQRLIAFFA